YSGLTNGAFSINWDSRGWAGQTVEISARPTTGTEWHTYTSRFFVGPAWEGHLDSPVDGSTVSGVIPISGWAKETSGRFTIKAIEILINGKLATSLPYSGLTNGVFGIHWDSSGYEGQTVEITARPTTGQYWHNYTSRFLVDTPPSKPVSLTITPTAPGHEPLTAHATGGTDADGDSLTYQYQWSKKRPDGRWEGFTYTGETLPASSVHAGETWGVRARAYDGTAYSPWNSACVTVTNMAGVTPAPKTYNVPVTTSVFASFRWPVKQSTVTTRVQLKLGTTKVIPTVMTWVTAERKVKLRPKSPLLPNTYYRINIDPGIVCTSGRVLGWGENYWFKTAPAATASTVSLSAAATSAGADLKVSLTSAATVRTAICNIAGRVVAELPERALPAGVTSLAWTGRSSTGTKVPPGMYLVRVTACAADGQRTDTVAPLMLRR
ncbi:MAG: Ig-like domain-containing protein, partial [Armatimonadia bacterium]